MLEDLTNMVVGTLNSKWQILDSKPTKMCSGNYNIFDDKTIYIGALYPKLTFPRKNSHIPFIENYNFLLELT